MASVALDYLEEKYKAKLKDKIKNKLKDKLKNELKNEYKKIYIAQGEKKGLFGHRCGSTARVNLQYP